MLGFFLTSYWFIIYNLTCNVMTHYEEVIQPKHFNILSVSVCSVFVFSDYGKLKQLLQASETENTKLQTEVKKLKKELESFDPTFFDEIEDLKYNYNLEVKKNILLEEQLKKMCNQFGVTAELPSVSIS